MGRKLRPVWQIKIDAYIFHYADDPRTIRAQELRIKELELAGTKTIASYDPRYGTGGGGGTTKEERHLLELEHAREQIALCRERIELIDGILQDYFNGEERQFIRLFWLDIAPGDRGLIQVRNHAVIKKIGWLRDPDDRRQPGREFRRWRLRIYNKWWNILFPDMPKENWETGYIEHIEEERGSKFLNDQELRCR